MSNKDIEVLQRALIRERKRREKSEHLLEEKTRELYIANKSLHDQYELLEKEKLKFEILASISSLFESNITTERMLSRYVESLSKILKFNAAHVYIIEETSAGLVFTPGDLWYLDGHGKYSEIVDITREIKFGFGNGLPGSTPHIDIYNLDSDNVSDIPSDPRLDCMRSEGFSSVIVAPITRHGEIISICEFYSEDNLDDKVSELLEYLTAASSQLKMVLERRFYENNLEDKCRSLLHPGGTSKS